MSRVILHSDLNNFYASVECLYNPQLKGKAVAVSGNPEKRHGIILAKNEIAKKCGVKTGQTLWQAKQLCPDIVFLPPDYKKYKFFSQKVKDIYYDYTDDIEPFGLDECWLDVTKSQRLFGSGLDIAEKIRNDVKKYTSLTVSIGVSFNKVFAKLGSDMKKPDAITVIDKDNFKKTVWHLPVEELLYVGRATKKKLNKYNIFTIKDLAVSDVNMLKRILGKNGYMLWLFANGFENSDVRNIKISPKAKSIGNSTTTFRDLTNDDDIKIILSILCENIARRLRQSNFKAGGIHLYLKDTSLIIHSVQKTLPFSTNTSETLFNEAFSIYKNDFKSYVPVRSIGVKAFSLTDDSISQLSFFPDEIKNEKILKLEKSIESLNFLYGKDCVRKGILYTDKILSDFEPIDNPLPNYIGEQNYISV